MMQVTTTCIYLLTKNFICISYLFYDFDLKFFRNVVIFLEKIVEIILNIYFDMLRVRQY